MHHGISPLVLMTSRTIFLFELFQPKACLSNGLVHFKADKLISYCEQAGCANNQLAASCSGFDVRTSGSILPPYSCPLRSTSIPFVSPITAPSPSKNPLLTVVSPREGFPKN